MTDTREHMPTRLGTGPRPRPGQGHHRRQRDERNHTTWPNIAFDPPTVTVLIQILRTGGR
ncbi:hypothetical protein HUT19_33770 [Streptomyces sp. NA02950]|uniref:hypothetical protein n=1 Tax=Streptomyces sp. NA02950 TaxID=2742137 RepID=UPI00159251D8|nr:hypothetical protein [Streptomyces sp. NA02950]QKV96083.1 hypothetical protein HUT19_33770 [Streptomyces sp. NA02950]